MKEQFRYKKFSTMIRIKYKDADGNQEIWEANQQDLICTIEDIVDTYAEQGYKLTARQLYYQLVSRDIIPNAHKVYVRICNFLTDLRYAGIIDWDAIEDRGRVPTKSSEWDTVSDLIESALYAYRLPRWSNQEYYVELYCEKQAMESVLLPMAKKYHIYFGINKGYSSASTMYAIAKRMEEKIAEGKRCVILYLGDHDPSGLDMVRDIQTRVCEFLNLSTMCQEFETIQIALNKKQIDEFDPPPNPAKITDPRAKWYLKEHGNKSWELDALEPKVLSEITEKAIRNYLDIDLYEDWIAREQKESKKLKAFGKSL